MSTELQSASNEQAAPKKRGGYRENGGRKPWDGPEYSLAATRFLEKRFKTTPMEFLMKTMCNTKHPMSMRIDAAAKLMPYCHPKLANVTITGEVAVRHESWLHRIERAALGDDAPVIDVTPEQVAA